MTAEHNDEVTQRVNDLTAEADRWMSNRPRHARWLLRSALQCAPDHVPARVRLGDCLLRDGRPQEAAAEYRHATASELGAGRLPEALGLAYRALQLDPGRFVAETMASVLRGLGDCAHHLCLVAAQQQLQRNDRPAATQLLQLAAELRPNCPATRQLLATQGVAPTEPANSTPGPLRSRAPWLSAVGSNPRARTRLPPPPAIPAQAYRADDELDFENEITLPFDASQSRRESAAG